MLEETEYQQEEEQIVYLRVNPRIFRGRSTVGRDAVNVSMLVRFQPSEPNNWVLLDSESQAPNCIFWVIGQPVIRSHNQVGSVGVNL